MRKKTIIIASILISFGIASYAQNPEWINYSYDNWVSDMAQEGDYLWLASRLGLYKISRLTGEKELFSSARGAPGNDLTAIAVDHDGNKWIGAGHCLAKFDNGTWTYYHSGNSPLPFAEISCLCVDKQNRLWVGTYHGVAILERDTWQILTHVDFNIDRSWVADIEEESSGAIWLATNNPPKLIKIDQDNWETHSLPSTSDQGPCHIRDLCLTENGKIWVVTSGSFGGYLACYDGNEWLYFADRNESDGANAAAEDQSGTIWFGSNSGDLSRFDGSTWMYFNSDNSPVRGRINSIFVDSDGFIWIGDAATQSGLLRFDGQRWLVIPLYTSPAEKPDRFSPLVIDNNNVVWWYESQQIENYTYMLGLGSFDGQEWRHYNLTEVYSSNGHSLIAADSNNVIWMVMRSDSNRNYRVARFDRSNWLVSPEIYRDGSVYDISDFSVREDNHIWLYSSLGLIDYNFKDAKIDNFIKYPKGIYIRDSFLEGTFVDDSQNIWIATEDGLLKYNGSVWTRYDTTNSELPNNNVCCIALADPLGLWITSWEFDLTFFDGNDWKRLPQFKATLLSLSQPSFADRITSVLEDPDNNLWLGSYFGLIKFDGTQVEIYNTLTSGLSDNQIAHLTRDGCGNLWIAPMKGGIDIFREGGIVGNFVSYSEAPYFISASHIPLAEKLFHAYPNPFNRVMTLRIDLHEPQFVRAIIYDLLGREVQLLINDQKTAGSHYAKFSGQGLATGIYFIRVEIGNKSSTQKILFIK